MTTGFAPAMARVVDALVERWQSRPEGSVVEVKSEMSHVALEALLRCIFSDGIGDPEAVGTATTRYYRTGGGLDPFDIIGLPDFIPRFTRRGIGSALDRLVRTRITSARFSVPARAWWSPGLSVWLSGA